MAITARPTLLVPGLIPRDPSRESYRVRAGAATLVTLAPDDRLTIRDVAGGQRAELTAIGLDGREDASRARGERGPSRHGAPRSRRLDSRRRGGDPRRARGARHRSDHDAGGRPLRHHVSAGRGGGLPGRPDRPGGRGCAGRGARGAGGRARVGSPAGRATRGATRRTRAVVARAARRATARLPGRPRLGARLRGQSGRVRPGDRRAGPPVLRLPGVQLARAAGGEGARSRLHCDAVADGQRVSATRPLLEVLHHRPGAARRGRSRHRRPPRHVRSGLHAQVLRGQGLFRPRQLLGQLQRAARAVHDRATRRLAGDQLLLQHVVRREQPLRRRRALVAAGGLRAAPGAHRPRLPLERVPGRHRRRQRLEPHGGARARLSGDTAVLGGHRASRHAGRRAQADEGDRVPHAHGGPHEPLHRVQRVLAADVVRQPRRRRRVLGLSRARRDDGSLALAEVRGARPGCRGALAGDDDARHPPARRRPGRLHGGVQRDRRHARRRHRVPHRTGQLPLRRRLGLRRHLVARAGGQPRPQPRLGEGVDGRAPQRGGAGTCEPRPVGAAALDGARADAVRRAQVVPLLGGQARRTAGAPA